MQYKVTTFVLGAIHNNVYVIEKDGKCLVIDPTYDVTFTVEKYIRQNNLQLQGVLLTHGHFDHCGGALHFQKQGIDVYINEKDTILSTSASKNYWNIPCEDVTPNKFYTEGTNIVGDFTFEVVFTPGHTIGGVCLIFGNLLFSGDTLFHNSIGRTDFPGGDDVNMEGSLRKIAAMNDSLVLYPGHGEYGMTLGSEKKSNQYLIVL